MEQLQSVDEVGGWDNFGEREGVWARAVGDLAEVTVGRRSFSSPLRIG
jgi:hypothetical protein